MKNVKSTETKMEKNITVCAAAVMALMILAASPAYAGGKVVVNGQLNVSGNSYWGGNSLYVDQSTGHVGIGTTSPNDILQVVTAGLGGIEMTNSANSVSGEFGVGTTSVYLGSLTNAPLKFYTNGASTQMTLDTTGYLGIGTTAPDAPLSVKSASQNAVVNIYGVSSGTDYGVIQVSSSGGLTNPAGRALALQPNAGNVGIGTTNPQAKLHVYGTGALYSQNTLLVENGATNGKTALQLKNDNQNWELLNNGADLYEFSLHDVNAETYPFLVEHSTPSNTLYLKGNGKVGINTTNPTETLTVNGNVSLNNTLYVLKTGRVGINTSAPAATLDVNGAIYQRGAQIYADVAEDYPVLGAVSPGDVVSFAGNGSVKEAGAGESVAGVVSEAPGYRIYGDDGWVPVALAGRVDVRFTGSVSPGDYVFSAGGGRASSGTLSLGNMKLVVGKALETKQCDSECRLMVMVGRM